MSSKIANPGSRSCSRPSGPKISGETLNRGPDAVPATSVCTRKTPFKGLRARPARDIPTELSHQLLAIYPAAFSLVYDPPSASPLIRCLPRRSKALGLAASLSQLEAAEASTSAGFVDSRCTASHRRTLLPG